MNQYAESMDWRDMAGENLVRIDPTAGGSLPLEKIPCAYCSAKMGYKTLSNEHLILEKGRTLFNLAVKCNNCANINFITMEQKVESYAGAYASASRHEYVRYPLGEIPEFKVHESWPAHIGRYFSQAAAGIEKKSWDAVIIMCRSTLQAIVRDKNAKGKNLKEEIDNLGGAGLLPSPMITWSHQIREIANEAAHPKADDLPPTETEAREIVKFTHFMLEVLYTIPSTVPRPKKSP